MKYTDLQNVHAALDALAAFKLPVSASLIIAKNLSRTKKIVAAQMALINAEKAKYQKNDESGQPVLSIYRYSDNERIRTGVPQGEEAPEGCYIGVTFDEDDHKHINDFVNAINDEEHDVEWSTLKASHFNSTDQIPAGALVALIEAGILEE